MSLSYECSFYAVFLLIHVKWWQLPHNTLWENVKCNLTIFYLDIRVSCSGFFHLPRIFYLIFTGWSAHCDLVHINWCWTTRLKFKTMMICPQIYSWRFEPYFTKGIILAVKSLSHFSNTLADCKVSKAQDCDVHQDM